MRILKNDPWALLREREEVNLSEATHIVAGIPLWKRHIPPNDNSPHELREEWAQLAEAEYALIGDSSALCRWTDSLKPESKRKILEWSEAGWFVKHHEDGREDHYGPIPIEKLKAWCDARGLRPEYFYPEKGEAQTAGSVPDELTPKREKTLLRIIRALDVMANLPMRGPASSVLQQVEELGFNGPSDDTIREVLKAARELEPDRNPKSDS